MGISPEAGEGVGVGDDPVPPPEPGLAQAAPITTHTANPNHSPFIPPMAARLCNGRSRVSLSDSGHLEEALLEAAHSNALRRLQGLQPPYCRRRFPDAP